MVQQRMFSRHFEGGKDFNEYIKDMKTDKCWEDAIDINKTRPVVI